MHHNYDYFKNNERDEYLQNATDELEHFIGTNYCYLGKTIASITNCKLQNLLIVLGHIHIHICKIKFILSLIFHRGH